jgi:hypothetical protein
MERRERRERGEGKRGDEKGGWMERDGRERAGW